MSPATGPAISRSFQECGLCPSFWTPCWREQAFHGLLISLASEYWLAGILAAANALEVSESIQWAMRGDIAVHVTDVPRGAACGCLCAHCHGPLVAKQGRERVFHFAHESGVYCSHAGETAVLLAAKKIIQRRACLVLPESSQKVPGARRTYKPRPAGLFQFQQVELEKSISERICPDAVATGSNGGRLAIEIHVTRPIDGERRRRYLSYRIAAIEIHLFDCILASPLELERAVIEDPERKWWISDPRGEDAYRAELAKAQPLEIRRTTPVSIPYVLCPLPENRGVVNLGVCKACGLCADIKDKYVLCKAPQQLIQP